MPLCFSSMGLLTSLRMKYKQICSQVCCQAPNPLYFFNFLTLHKTTTYYAMPLTKVHIALNIENNKKNNEKVKIPLEVANNFILFFTDYIVLHVQLSKCFILTLK